MMTKHEARQRLTALCETPHDLRLNCRQGHAQCAKEQVGHCIDDLIQAGVVHVDDDDQSDDNMGDC